MHSIRDRIRQVFGKMTTTRINQTTAIRGTCKSKTLQRIKMKKERV